MTTKVFIDANLLFFTIISDLLFDASKLGLIDAFWSQQVIDEFLEHAPRVIMETSAKRNKPMTEEEARSSATKKIEGFKKYSGFQIVTDYESIIIPEDALTDKDDLHVLKAALKTNCSVLLTLDKGFRKIKNFDELSLVAKKADDFFCELLKNQTDLMLSTVEETVIGIAAKRKNYYSTLDLISEMSGGTLPKFANALGEILN